MKILAINSSSHGEKGATQLILNRFLEGTRKAGADVDTVFLNKLSIRPCLGCYKCWVKTPGFCVQEDDMGGLIVKLQASDLLIFAGPVYVDGISGHGKLFLDRLLPLMDCHLMVKDGNTRHTLRIPKFPPVFGIVTCGFYERDNTYIWTEHLKRACKNFSAEYMGTLIRPSSHILFWKKDYEEAIGVILKAACQAGEDLVSKGRVSMEIVDKVGGDFLSRDEVIRLSNIAWDKQLRRAQNPS